MSRWLAEVHLPQYSDGVLAEGLVGQGLLLATPEDLMAAGVKSAVHRQLLMQAIKQLVASPSGLCTRAKVPLAMPMASSCCLGTCLSAR